MTEGWYYLHANGDLIYKGAAYTSLADLDESDLVRAFWAFREGDREQAWTLLVEALAADANPERVHALAAGWGCTNEDAQTYARHIDVGLIEYMYGGWAAYPLSRPIIERGQSGLTCLEAMAALARTLGYQAAKTGGPSFPVLVARVNRAAR